MFNVNPWMARLLVATPLALGLCAPAFGQMQALRKSDDQFIQGLREQGMSELLEHFVESDPPSDPIAQAALEVALKEFVAAEQLQRVQQAQLDGNIPQAIELFNKSRQSFEDVLAAQRNLIKNNPEDDRLPLWQTDFAELLLYKYLPTYFQGVEWAYEFGQPSPEQGAAFEQAMVEAYTNLAQANDNLGTLDRRIAADGELRPRLESLGIWFKLKDYQSVNTPYWLGRAALGVSLLPDGHPYFDGGKVKGQKNVVAEEKKRLRYVVVDAYSGAIKSDERPSVKLDARLYPGRALVRSDDINDIDDGVEMLESVIADSPNTQHGFLATLGKAVGRWKAGELDVALPILTGMGSHQYVEARMNEGDIVPRLLSADLKFKILIAESNKKPPSERPALVAEAYNKSYADLIGGDDRYQPFRDLLFERWAAAAGDVEDPTKLPPAVRLGIGERLTQEGGLAYQKAVQKAMQPAPEVPAEAERWKRELESLYNDAVSTLGRAVSFNQTLVGEDMEPGPVLAKGLFNLGMNKYNLAELDKIFVRGGNPDPAKYLEVAELWLAVAVRVPDAQQVKDALTYSMSLTVMQDQFFNKDGVARLDVRKVFEGSFEKLSQGWPNEAAVNNQRLYAGFYLYEKQGHYEKAVTIYDALPRDHADYFQARRQLVGVLQKRYRATVDELRLVQSKQPDNIAPDGVDPAEHEQKKNEWKVQEALLQQTLDSLRNDIVEEAELIILDAEDAVENAQTPARRFTAATALGASRVVLAGIEADRDKPEAGLKMLEGFEAQYAPDGPYADLAALQPEPEASKDNLQRLIQSAQEQRILILLEAGKTQDMVDQARDMMDQAPDVAASVVHGVLRRIRATIEREKRAKENAPFKQLKDKADENIKFQANAAVKLGELLVQWAKAQGYDKKKMVPFRLALVESLLLAGKPGQALTIMEPLVKDFENSLEVRMKTGMAYLEKFRLEKPDIKGQEGIKIYNAAVTNFGAIVTFFNSRPEKPAQFWEAWLRMCELRELAGGELAKKLPDEARKLLSTDEELGGPAFKSKFLEIFERNGGVRRVEQQP